MSAKLTLVSAFSGIGGLDFGLESAGFSPVALIERDRDARQALKVLRPTWPLLNHADVCTLTPTILRKGKVPSRVTLLAGGPPCQPFSKAGDWSKKPLGYLDPRASTMSGFFRLAAMVRPQVILIENVPGLVTRKFGLSTLRSAFTRLNKLLGTNYVPSVLSIHAEDFGIPQRRHRVFILAHYKGKVAALPPATHSADASEHSKGKTLPLIRAWDAIAHLDSNNSDDRLKCTGRWADLLPSIPEGQNYLFHTSRGGGLPIFGYRTRYWSFLLKLAKDQPAWTLSASPGPATGPFHWRNRRLSAHEMAALQTIPLQTNLDIDIRIYQRLIGNAVPSALGELLGKIIRKQLLNEDVEYKLKLIPRRRNDLPPVATIGNIPPKYVQSNGLVVREHPGPGKGPGAKARLRRSLVATG